MWWKESLRATRVGAQKRVRMTRTMCWEKGLREMKLWEKSVCWEKGLRATRVRMRVRVRSAHVKRSAGVTAGIP